MMRTILRKRFRKRIAILLLAVMLIPLIPFIPVFADVEPPEFPYGNNSWYQPDVGSVALWEVHGSEKVSYVQTFTNVIPDIGAFQVVWRDGMSYVQPYTYSLDYTAITDTWTKAGNHVDGGYSWTANIRVPAPGETTVVGSDVYATLVYCTTDITYSSGSGRSIYAYQNFIMPDYADPTPTPEPDDEPSSPIPDNDLIDGSDLLFLLRVIDENNVYYNQYVGLHIDNMLPWLMSGGKIYLPYFRDTDGGVTCTMQNGFLFWKISGDNPLYRFYRYGDDLPLSSSLNTYIDIVSFNNMFNASWGFSSGGQAFGLEDGSFSLAGNVGSQSLFEIVAFNHTYDDNLIINFDSSITPTPTPTPSVAPTAIPQPSITPEPTVEPPDEGDDGNWTGLFGWFKKLINAILSIPMKIINGILGVLKYIFIPDINKIKSLFNTLNDKFGIQKPVLFEFDPILLRNPDNVVMHFKPISLNGEPTETVDVTIIDFDKVDDWLESAPGQTMIRIIQAVYMLTMWGYMIYIYRKHVATINYTDADTLFDKHYTQQ